MVGIRRSQACNSCLRRKKGCDKQKPSCGQCRKACIPCQGYDRPHTFVNSFAQHEGKKLTQIRQNHMFVLSSDKMNRSANEGRILDMFWQLYFPNGEPLPTGVVSSTLGGWMHHIRHIYTFNNTLKKAILAFAISTIGEKCSSSSWMEKEGRRLYGEALLDMSAMLRMPQKRREPFLLATVRIFSLFEAVYGADDENSLTQARSWLVHSIGDRALILERGPIEFTSGVSHTLFVDGRLHLITAAIKDKKRSFLSETEWKVLPWSNIKKSPKDLLLDTLADVPTLFELIDLMSSCHSTSCKMKHRKLLYEEYLRAKDGLALWNTNYASLVAPPEEDVIIPDTITSQTLSKAHLSTLYWCTCIIIYGIINRAIITPETEFLDDQNVDPGILCRRLISTIPIFFYQETGIFRVHLATFPLGVVMMYLAINNQNELIEERALLTKYLLDPACSSMRKLLASMEPQSFKSVHSEIVSECSSW